MEKEQNVKVISSRRLLKRLREVMSAEINVQEKLSDNRDGASSVSVGNTQQEAYRGKQPKIGR